ncbi:MAG: AmmeMemoRadiSam system radical SAM enzyme [Armatimonadota bacterium]|nr:AmmeMemoRadiSam system radical SAM enzyme [Armatimonadota bacterium]MCX7776575.1 AmmeMemoRadiSam system radical SAM enzyme [Armatimonadota bacterium]MDW8026091.1 AmmeMemoRadiSam system radical SAM enzyme [Armatimonadota bacterium]
MGDDLSAAQMTQQVIESRRKFLKRTLICCIGSLCAFGHRSDASGVVSLIRARFYRLLSDGRVVCELCPRMCIVSEGERGFCGARENRNGVYYTLVYGRVCAKLVDPIEKLPLYHVLPGIKTFGIATACCNLTCKYCQSWQISQARPEDTQSVYMRPSDVVEEAKALGCRAIAYTYTEPVNFIEYAIDCAKEARRAGLLNICHTAAYINPEPMRELCQYMDAINIDLKAFSESFYRDVCGGQLKPVLEAIKIVVNETNAWLELTYLVVPSLNDNERSVKEMCDWLKQNVGTDVPLHFTRFFPIYKLRNLPATPAKTIDALRRVAFQSGLRYVYVGNVPGHGGESTYCPRCGSLLIQRVNYVIRSNRMRKGRCPDCGMPIPGIWS